MVDLTVGLIVIIIGVISLIIYFLIRKFKNHKTVDMFSCMVMFSGSMGLVGGLGSMLLGILIASKTVSIALDTNIELFKVLFNIDTISISLFLGGFALSYLSFEKLRSEINKP